MAESNSELTVNLADSGEVCTSSADLVESPHIDDMIDVYNRKSQVEPPLTLPEIAKVMEGNFEGVNAERIGQLRHHIPRLGAFAVERTQIDSEPLAADSELAALIKETTERFGQVCLEEITDRSEEITATKELDFEGALEIVTQMEQPYFSFMSNRFDSLRSISAVDLLKALVEEEIEKGDLEAASDRLDQIEAKLGSPENWARLRAKVDVGKCLKSGDNKFLSSAIKQDIRETLDELLRAERHDLALEVCRVGFNDEENDREKSDALRKLAWHAEGTPEALAEIEKEMRTLKEESKRYALRAIIEITENMDLVQEQYEADPEYAGKVVLQLLQRGDVMKAFWFNFVTASSKPFSMRQFKEVGEEEAHRRYMEDAISKKQFKRAMTLAKRTGEIGYDDGSPSMPKDRAKQLLDAGFTPDEAYQIEHARNLCGNRIGMAKTLSQLGLKEVAYEMVEKHEKEEGPVGRDGIKYLVELAQEYSDPQLYKAAGLNYRRAEKGEKKGTKSFLHLLLGGQASIMDADPLLLIARSLNEPETIIESLVAIAGSVARKGEDASSIVSEIIEASSELEAVEKLMALTKLNREIPGNGAIEGALAIAKTEAIGEDQSPKRKLQVAYIGSPRFNTWRANAKDMF
jgi:hypothetical protein